MPRRCTICHHPQHEEIAVSLFRDGRDKYGVKDVTKYYSKFDVAVMVALSC